VDAPASGEVLVLDARQPGAQAPALGVATTADAASVTLNERTTVAAGYGLAQFYGRELPSGAEPGLGNAVSMAADLADPATGAYGDVLTSYPNGTQTSTLPAFTSLANMLSACLLDTGSCEALYTAATGAVEPASGAAAFAALARDPAPAADELFQLSLRAASDRPGLSSAPDAWTLALRFDGDGSSLAGAGNFALDADGDIWINNNYQYDADPKTPVCGSDEMFEFAPNGALKASYAGGGLSGSGYGIAFDPQGRLWFSNYGFAAPAPGCPEADQPPHDSMSLFTQKGQALSPDTTGITAGGLSWPQGIDISPDGSVWIANCGNSTVAVYPQGDPAKARNLGSLGLEQPFDVVDNGRAVFVTGNINSAVAVIGRDGTPAANSPLTGAFDVPMGITADATGNVWVANSGGVTLPCPERNQEGRSTPSVTMISPDGQTVTGPFTGGGVTLPWGISTDGDGNVWVANFQGQRVSAFCGADAASCPRGLSTGDPISPDGTGYSFDGLTRSTGIMVDTAGNVWVTNNWETVPLQTNPGGHQIVAFVGAAAPVPAPTFG
jgi:sugar lactone lactonase YvrE